MAARNFTIDAANALIPRLEMLMEQMQRAALMLRGALQESPDAQSIGLRTLTEIVRERPDLAEYAGELERGVMEIEQLGCQFKGLDLGLVDFPAQLDGAEVLLCWQYGEKHVAYWHPADEGFAARRMLASSEPPALQ